MRPLTLAIPRFFEVVAAPPALIDARPPTLAGRAVCDHRKLMDQVTTVAEPDDNEVERDRPLNPYRYAASESADAIVREAIQLVQNYEEHFKLRRNKR